MIGENIRRIRTDQKMTQVALAEKSGVHDVPNYGYKMHFKDGKAFYATDTKNLNGIFARHYDLYLVEANYEDEIIQQKISDKKAAGEFAYEMRVLRSHLSKSQCDDWLYKNMAPNSEYVYLHCHEDEPEASCEES